MISTAHTLKGTFAVFCQSIISLEVGVCKLSLMAIMNAAYGQLREVLFLQIVQPRVLRATTANVMNLNFSTIRFQQDRRYPTAGGIESFC
mgnify:CR=1 FL=1